MTVEALFAGEEWTPTQCLVEALSTADTMESVVIAYFVKDSGGEVLLRMSNTDSRDLLFLGNAIEYYAMNGNDDLI